MKSISGLLNGALACILPFTGMQRAAAQVPYQSVHRVPDAEANERASLTDCTNPNVTGATDRVPLTNKILLLSSKFNDISDRVVSLQQFREVPGGILWQHVMSNGFGLKADKYFIYIDGLPETGSRMAKILNIN